MARKLMDVLGYAKWQRFREAIQCAVLACAKSGQEPADHCTGIGTMVTDVYPSGREAQQLERWEERPPL